MDHDGMNRAKMRAEAALIEATGLLFVMLDTEVNDLEELQTLRKLARSEAQSKGLVKSDTLKPTVAEQLHGGASGSGEMTITATLDVVAGDDNNLEIPELGDVEDDQ